MSDASTAGQRATVVGAAAGHKATNMLMATVMAVYIGRVGSPFVVSLVISVFFFGQTVFAPVWGGIADVTGRRRGVLVATSALSALSILPLVLFNGILGPLAFRTLYAVCIAGFLPVMFTIVSEWGGSTARGKAVGLFGSAAAAGSVFGRVTSGPLLNSLSRPSVYLVVAGLGSFLVVACLFVKDPTPTHGADRDCVDYVAEIRDRLVPDPGGGMRHLRVNGLHWLYVASFLRNATILGIGSLLPVFFLSVLEVSSLVMGVLLGINPAVQVLGMYVVGRHSDAAGRKRLITGGLAGSGLYILVVTGASLLPTVSARAVVAGAGMVTLGFAYSGVQTGMVAFIGDVAPTERESELIGLRSTARGLGGVVGPPLIGVGATGFGYRATFAFASLFAFASAALVGYRLVESHGPAAVAESG
jgi:MFS family permease